MVGMVVIERYRMCVNNSAPAEAEARLVVSDNGDSLSPKYAPERIAPAMRPGSIPSTVPTPIKAIPMVAEVVQELPVNTDTTAQIMQVANRKITGVRTCSP